MKNTVNIKNIKKGEFVTITYNRNWTLTGIVLDKDNEGIVCYYNDGILRISTKEIVDIKRLNDIEGEEIETFVNEVLKMYKERCKIQKQLNKLNVDINNINNNLNTKRKDLSDILFKSNLTKNTLLVAVESLKSKYSGIYIKAKEENNKIVVRLSVDYSQIEVISLDDLGYIRNRCEREFKNKVYGLGFTNIEDSTYHIDDEWWQMAFSMDLVLEIAENPYNTLVKITSILDKVKEIQDV